MVTTWGWEFYSSFSRPRMTHQPRPWSTVRILRAKFQHLILMTRPNSRGMLGLEIISKKTKHPNRYFVRSTWLSKWTDLKLFLSTDRPLSLIRWKMAVYYSRGIFEKSLPSEFNPLMTHPGGTIFRVLDTKISKTTL